MAFLIKDEYFESFEGILKLIQDLKTENKELEERLKEATKKKVRKTRTKKIENV